MCIGILWSTWNTQWLMINPKHDCTFCSKSLIISFDSQILKTIFQWKQDMIYIQIIKKSLTTFLMYLLFYSNLVLPIHIRIFSIKSIFTLTFLLLLPKIKKMSLSTFNQTEKGKLEIVFTSVSWYSYLFSIWARVNTAIFISDQKYTWLRVWFGRK